MRNLLQIAAKLWDKFGPVPVEYGMFEIKKGNQICWSVFLLRGNIKVRIGPKWTNPYDCLRFMEALNVQEEACYE